MAPFPGPYLKGKDVPLPDPTPPLTAELSILELFTQQLHYPFALGFSVSLLPAAKAALLMRKQSILFPKQLV